MALTAEQIAIVKSTAPVIKEHGKAITTVFYERLLAAHPELKNIFSLRHQQVGAQQAALAEAVFAYAAHIDDLARLSGAVERIAQKHASLFIKPEQYPIVGKFLVAAFAEVLGDALTADVTEAWVAAYDQLANVFIGREKQLYDEVDDWRDWRAFTVARKEAEADDVVSFYLKPKDGRPLPHFLAGQYVSARVAVPELDGLFQSRQFSLSTAPEDGMDMYRVSVKREETVKGATAADLAEGKVPGLISNKLHDDYSVGDELELSPPRGEFFLDSGSGSAQASPVVLLSIGVGATPLMSILQSLAPSPNSVVNGSSGGGGSRPVSWVHGARHAGSVCFGKAVRDMAARQASIRPVVFVKQVGAGDEKGRDYDVEGRLSMERAEAEGALHLDDGSTGYYICGPESWMVQTRAWLEGRGVARERIHLELFSVGEV